MIKLTPIKLQLFLAYFAYHALKVLLTSTQIIGLSGTKLKRNYLTLHHLHSILLCTCTLMAIR
jgi:hypothetical protein